MPKIIDKIAKERAKALYEIGISLKDGSKNISLEEIAEASKSWDNVEDSGISVKTLSQWKVSEGWERGRLNSPEFKYLGNSDKRDLAVLKIQAETSSEIIAKYKIRYIDSNNIATQLINDTATDIFNMVNEMVFFEASKPSEKKSLDNIAKLMRLTKEYRDIVAPSKIIESSLEKKVDIDNDELLRRLANS